MQAIQRVNAARAKGRATAIKYIENIFTDFLPLAGDKRFAEDRAVIAGVAKLDNMSVTVIGLEKGTDLQGRITHNFGSANPEGYRKALRQFYLAEKFNRPVVCFVDTAGAHPGIGAEERGQGQAIAENLTALMTLKVPVISIIVGEGGSGGALALAVCDRLWMLENSIFSVISPEGCASILWKDARKASKAAESLKLTAQDLYSFSITERIISENQPQQQIYREIKQGLTETITELRQLSTQQLLLERYTKFRNIGSELI